MKVRRLPARLFAAIDSVPKGNDRITQHYRIIKRLVIMLTDRANRRRIAFDGCKRQCCAVGVRRIGIAQRFAHRIRHARSAANSVPLFRRHAGFLFFILYVLWHRTAPDL